jgi:hypothetical protein
LFDPFAGPEHAPTFPATLPLAGATFVAMLQITLVSERWPLERLPRRTGGACTVVLSWIVALLLYVLVLGGRPFSGSGPDPAAALTSGAAFGAALTCVGVWQVWLSATSTPASASRRAIACPRLESPSVTSARLAFSPFTSGSCP